jgi:hypothetical protein
MRRLMLALVVVLAACGGVTPTPRPTEVPTPTPRADIAAQITDTIDLLMCAEPPSPSWCKYLRKTAGLYDVTLADGILTVGTVIPDTAKGMDLAREMCLFLGGTHYDDNAVDLGYYLVRIYRGSLEMAICPTTNRE